MGTPIIPSETTYYFKTNQALVQDPFGVQVGPMDFNLTEKDIVNEILFQVLLCKITLQEV